MTSCEEELAAYVNTLRAYQFHARYPMLLLRDRFGADVLRWKRHANIGLISVAVRHGDLDDRQQSALNEFRLHQYVICGLYDAKYALQHGLVTDPAGESIPNDTLHVLVGTDDAKLLAYFSLQPAASDAPLMLDSVEASSASWLLSGREPRMGDIGRPMLPTEFEMFGTSLFTALPGFSTLPVSEVRELSSLLANQTLQSTLTLAAIVEAFQTMGSITTDPTVGVRLLMSHADLEARQIIARLGMPTMYAPLAPVVVEPREDFWNAAVNVQGAFWPNLTARDDLYRHTAHFQRAEEVLELPAAELRRALVQMLKHPFVTAPRAFMPKPGSSTVFWTSDPKAVRTGAEARIGAKPQHNEAAG